jgi:hypothetical protein
MNHVHIGNKMKGGCTFRCSCGVQTADHYAELTTTLSESDECVRACMELSNELNTSMERRETNVEQVRQHEDVLARALAGEWNMCAHKHACVVSNMQYTGAAGGDYQRHLQTLCDLMGIEVQKEQDDDTEKTKDTQVLKSRAARSFQQGSSGLQSSCALRAVSVSRCVTCACRL